MADIYDERAEGSAGLSMFGRREALAVRRDYAFLHQSYASSDRAGHGALAVEAPKAEGGSTLDYCRSLVRYVARFGSRPSSAD